LWWLARYSSVDLRGYARLGFGWLPRVSWAGHLHEAVPGSGCLKGSFKYGLVGCATVQVAGYYRVGRDYMVNSYDVTMPHTLTAMNSD